MQLAFVCGLMAVLCSACPTLGALGAWPAGRAAVASILIQHEQVVVFVQGSRQADYMRHHREMLTTHNLLTTLMPDLACFELDADKPGSAAVVARHGADVPYLLLYTGRNPNATRLGSYAALHVLREVQQKTHRLRAR
jgi:hypothetical protein